MKKEKLNIMFCSFPDYSSNAKPLYQYMYKRYKNKMNFYWVVRTDEMYQILKEAKINVCKLKSDEYYEWIKSSDVLFDTHGDFAGDKPKGTLYIELWHGIGPKAIGYISNNLSIDDYNWCQKLKRKVDYFIVPSDFWRTIFSARFNINYNRTISLGYPKLDFFKDENCINKLEKVIEYPVKKYNKIIYYMPTFRNGCNRKDTDNNQNGIFNVQAYDENKVIKYLEKNNYLLCIKKHPSEELNLSFNENNNIRIITDHNLSLNQISINEILNASDLLITDYSSLGIEYIYLDKPVIYITNDLEQYKKNRGVTFSDVNFWMPGHQVSTLTDLLNSINDCLSKNYSLNDIMQKKKKLWFGDLNNGGCKEICDFLFDNYKISNQIKYYYDKEENMEKEISEMNNKIKSLDEKIIEQNNYINSIISSKGWKLLEKLRKIKRKLFRK